MKAITLLFTLIFFSFTLSAQNLEGGIFIGAANYAGDLVEPKVPEFGENSIAGGLLLRHHINNKLAVRTNLFFGQIKGNDQNYTSRSDRGFSFTSFMGEASLNLEWSPLSKPRYNSDGSFKKSWSPYFFAGFGGNYSNPKTDYNTNDIPTSLLDKVEEDQSSLSSNFNVTFPIGGGVKFDLNEKLTLGIDGGVRPTMSDLLDGVSQSGNPDANDWYYFGGVTLTGRFGKKDNKKVLNNMVEAEEDKPLDRDSDGIPDFDDQCPTQVGKAAFNGCPDTDDDGIADKNDTCPDIAGLREFNGCPDTDKDGVADNDDDCPDLSGAVALNGCPDRDNDGIADKDDKCPDELGVTNNGGCPEVIVEAPVEEAPVEKTTEDYQPMYGESDGQAKVVKVDNRVTNIEVVELLEDAMEQVKFDLSSVNIKTESYPILDEIANLMSVHPDYYLTIKGYTDNSGENDVNDQLSMRRARRCYKYLASMGVSPRKMTFVGLGEANPIASNETEAGRKKNRRVEFEITRM